MQCRRFFPDCRMRFLGSNPIETRDVPRSQHATRGSLTIEKVNNFKASFRMTPMKPEG